MAILGAVLVGADLLLDRLVLADGTFLGRPVAPFDPPLFSPSQFKALQHLEEELANERPSVKFDADLGWCNKPESGFGEFRYDWAGARIGVEPLARSKTPGVRRLAVFGCSMTHGEEVGASETWCARLDALAPNVEIANLGVAAYGLDQALLRLRRDGWPLAPDEVWLAVLPQAALRVTTRFRPLLDHWSLDVAFKPCFTWSAENELELVPNPAASLQDVPRLLRDQQAFLQALGGDTWVARAPRAYAPRGSSWLQHSFSARLILTALERTGRDLEACFDERQPFGKLFTGIVRATAAECAQHGSAFRLLILPGPDDFRGRARAGRGYWEDWAAQLRKEGLTIVDLSEALVRSGLDAGRIFARDGHYGAEACDTVARALVGELGG